MNIVLFTQEELEGALPLRDARIKHIRNVLHKGVGDAFDAGVVNGMSGVGCIAELGEGGARIEFEPQREEPPLYGIQLIVGFPRPIQLKRLLRDVSSLGVAEIHLTGTELGEKSYQQSTLLERGAAYEGLLDGAAQAKSTRVPQLCRHNSLEECFAALGLEAPSAAQVPPHAGQEPRERILLDNVKPVRRLSDFAAERAFKGKRVVAAIGSERGWTDGERAAFAAAGFTSCSLGARILRTETAATTAVSLVLAAMDKL